METLRHVAFSTAARVSASPQDVAMAFSRGGMPCGVARTRQAEPTGTRHEGYRDVDGMSRNPAAVFRVVILSLSGEATTAKSAIETIFARRPPPSTLAVGNAARSRVSFE